jgi:hypothetical protein
LYNDPSAVRCLVGIIGELNITSVDDAGSRKELRRAAKALRTIFDQEEDRSTAAIDEFHNCENLDVITILAYGARSGSRDTRVGSTLVLGNVAQK